MSPPVVLLLGAEGQVGWRLRDALAALGRVAAVGRTQVDLTDPIALRTVVRALRPRVVVNAAAYTAVDRAQQERDLAYRVNAEAPGVLAEETRRLGSLLVHFSTDYVFDGTSDRPYAECDAPRPVNAYGATKLAGEEAVIGRRGHHFVIRTAWVYDTRGNNFVRTILRLAREREELRVVADQFGAPTWAAALADAASRMVGSWLAEPDPARSGIYHASAGGETSWYHFARAVLESDPVRAEQICRSVVPIGTDEYPTPARRPAYSVLSNRRLHDVFGVTLPAWRDQLSAALGAPRRPDPLVAAIVGR